MSWCISDARLPSKELMTFKFVSFFLFLSFFFSFGLIYFWGVFKRIELKCKVFWKIWSLISKHFKQQAVETSPYWCLMPNNGLMTVTSVFPAHSSLLSFTPLYSMETRRCSLLVVDHTLHTPHVPSPPPFSLPSLSIFLPVLMEVIYSVCLFV